MPISDVSKIAPTETMNGILLIQKKPPYQYTV